MVLEVASFRVFEGSFGVEFRGGVSEAEARSVSDPEECRFGSGRGQFIVHVPTTTVGIAQAAVVPAAMATRTGRIGASSTLVPTVFAVPAVVLLVLL